MREAQGQEENPLGPFADYDEDAPRMGFRESDLPDYDEGADTLQERYEERVRAGFEAWFLKDPRVTNPVKASTLNRTKDGRYRLASVQYMWEAWDAAWLMAMAIRIEWE